MGKRRRKSAERENKELWKRLKRLERRLEKQHAQDSPVDRSLSHSRSRSGSWERVSVPDGSIISLESRRASPSVKALAPENTASLPAAIVSESQQPALMAAPNPPSQATSATAPEELSDDILQLLGKRILVDRVPAQAIPTDLVVRIEEIIQKGLPAEEKQQLLQKFPPPSNCLVLDPPTLNLEIKACLQEAVTKRDARIVDKQTRIAAGIAGLVSVMSTVLKLSTDEKLNMVERLSGVIRILLTCNMRNLPSAAASL